MNKLWDKGFEVDGKIAAFTVGKDRELDLLLAPFDILGTIAHITMLESRGLLSRKELDRLLPELRGMYSVARAGNFVIGEGVEDVHSQVELDLTRILGDLGKKIHTGRSRNDQVAVDIRLFTRSAIERTVLKVKALFDVLQKKERGVQGHPHARLHPPAGRHAVVIRPLVRSLC